MRAARWTSSKKIRPLGAVRVHRALLRLNAIGTSATKEIQLQRAMANTPQYVAMSARQNSEDAAEEVSISFLNLLERLVQILVLLRTHCF